MASTQGQAEPSSMSSPQNSVAEHQDGPYLILYDTRVAQRSPVVLAPPIEGLIFDLAHLLSVNEFVPLQVDTSNKPLGPTKRARPRGMPPLQVKQVFYSRRPGPASR